MMRLARIAIGGATALLGVSGCTGGDGSTAATSDGRPPASAASTVAPIPNPTSPRSPEVDPLLAHLDDTGTLTLDGALALFAATHAPLPGVEPAEVPADHDASILTTLASRRAELTDEQWAIVEVVIGVGSRTVFEPVGLRSAPRAGQSDLAEPIIADSVSYFSAKLGRPLTIPITVVELPMYGPGDIAHFPSITVAASASGYSSRPTGELDECLIRFNTSAVYDPRAFPGQVAHEVYHCFQYVTGVSRPEWVLEGQAGYAGEEFVGGSNQSRTWWPRWIGTPQRPLTERSYDAIGLYSLTAALGADPYAYFDALYASPDVAVIRSATGPTLDDAWALHLANEPSWGDRYVVAGPAAPSIRGNRYVVHLAVDGGAGVFNYRPRLAELGAQVYEFDAPGDIVSIDPNGATGGVRFRGGVEMMFSTGSATDFCTAPGGCVCPDDPPGPVVDVTDSRAFVGVGPSAGATPIIRAVSLDEWCGERAPPPTVATPDPGACEIGMWRSTSLVLPPTPGLTTVTSGGDGVMVMFGDDGSFLADYGAMNPAVAEATIPDGPAARTAVTFSGMLSGTWNRGPDGRLVVDAAGDSVRVVADMTVGGATNRFLDTTLAELAGVGGAAATFTVSSCVGSTLEVSSVFSGGSVTMILDPA